MQRYFATFRTLRNTLRILEKSPAISSTNTVGSNCCLLQLRSFQTTGLKHEVRPTIGKLPWFRKYPTLNVPWTQKGVLRMTALRTYLCIMEIVNFDQFASTFQLEDTLYSWYTITELHLWMVSVRLGQEGDLGQFVKHELVRYLWEDISNRISKLGTTRKQKKSGLLKLHNDLEFAMVCYDDGLLGDDKRLAGAVWCQFLKQTCDDPTLVELLVKYVRKQIAHLDNLSQEDILTSGLINFLPLGDDVYENEDRLKNVFTEITHRTGL